MRHLHECSGPRRDTSAYVDALQSCVPHSLFAAVVAGEDGMPYMSDYTPTRVALLFPTVFYVGCREENIAAVHSQIRLHRQSSLSIVC